MLGQIDELQIRRWAREETVKVIQEQTQIRQDACEHWVSGTYRKGILHCDACDKILTSYDVEAGQEREDPTNISLRYTQKVL